MSTLDRSGVCDFKCGGFHKSMLLALYVGSKFNRVTDWQWILSTIGWSADLS